MSSGVSQINFWQQEPLKTAKEVLNKEKRELEQDTANKGTFLSYDVFLGLTIFLGFFAIDHLYLRSPMTFLAKIIVNIFGLGVWWLYDASQAFFNKEVVKVFGLSIPGMGPKGIAAGVLTSDKPDKKHLNFLFYALALIFGGVIGLDSFLVGNKQAGIIRLISFITIIFAPVAMIWWLFNLFKFFFQTKSVVETNWEYFGAPSPLSEDMSILDQIILKIPFLSYLLGPIKIASNTVQAVAENPDIIIKGPIGKAISVASEAAGPVVIPVTSAVESASQAVSNVASAAKSSINLATATVETAGEIGKDIAETVKPLVNLADEAVTIQSSLSPESISAAATKALTQQQGGSDASNTLGYVLLSVFSLIAVSGFVLTYLRTKKNGKPERNDQPPEPRVL
jgi:hypothetical protein